MVLIRTFFLCFVWVCVCVCHLKTPKPFAHTSVCGSKFSVCVSVWLSAMRQYVWITPHAFHSNTFIDIFIRTYGHIHIHKRTLAHCQHCCKQCKMLGKKHTNICSASADLLNKSNKNLCNVNSFGSTTVIA